MTLVSNKFCCCSVYLWIFLVSFFLLALNIVNISSTIYFNSHPWSNEELFQLKAFMNQIIGIQDQTMNQINGIQKDLIPKIQEPSKNSPDDYVEFSYGLFQHPRSQRFSHQSMNDISNDFQDQANKMFDWALNPIRLIDERSGSPTASVSPTDLGLPTASVSPTALGSPTYSAFNCELMISLYLLLTILLLWAFVCCSSQAGYIVFCTLGTIYFIGTIVYIASRLTNHWIISEKTRPILLPNLLYGLYIFLVPFQINKWTGASIYISYEWLVAIYFLLAALLLFTLGFLIRLVFQAYRGEKQLEQNRLAFNQNYQQFSRP